MHYNYDFITIGDTTIDAFIHLQDASVHCDINKENCEICMRFGDKIPYKEVFVVPAVGNSANAAVSAARLGLRSALVANIGDDRFGEECLDVFKEERVATDFIKINKGMKTNYHYVLWYESDRTILVKHETYEYGLPDIGTPQWMYLSSLGENSLVFHNTIAKYLEAHPDVQLAFQPGTYQMKFGTQALADIYKNTAVFFCNKEEAQRILDSKETDVKKLMAAMHALGPKIVAITDGVNGAYASDGNEALRIPMYPDPKPPIQRTGAGDAFASTFTVALAMGKSVREALTWGPVNSMSVVQNVGARAGLLTIDRLEEYLANAPKEYVATSI